MQKILVPDTVPHLPNGWKIRSHRPLGGDLELYCNGEELFLGSKKIGLFLLEEQKSRRGIELNSDLVARINTQAVLNANVCDVLYLNQHLIPSSFRRNSQGAAQTIYFWGTEIATEDERLFVMGLYWNDEANTPLWELCSFYLPGFGNPPLPLRINDPAVVLVG